MRQRITSQQQRTLADRHAQIEEGLSVIGLLLSKTTGASPALNGRFDATSCDLVGPTVRSQLAGRWRMATMNVIFVVIPAAIHLAAGPPDLGRDDEGLAATRSCCSPVAGTPN